MTDSQILVSVGKETTSFDELHAYIDARRAADTAVSNFEAFECEARRRFAAAEAEFVDEELARFDVDVPAVEVDGVPHRRVLRCSQTYMQAAASCSMC